MRSLFAERALLPEGWRSDVRLDLGRDGSIIAVAASARPDGAERLRGPVVPGMPNLHSHAFQRAMAGLAEGGDGFWTWRAVMYRFLERLQPEHVEAIAALLQAECLRHGYTAIAEFHYLHHDPAGQPYADPAEMARRIVAAARRSGIGLTLLPVLYAHSDFGGAAPGPGQRRFLCDVAQLMAIRDAFAEDGQLRLGVAAHSLRAVSPELLRALLAAQDARDATAPLHIHVAEQTAEVEACLAWSGRRPVQWLLDEVGLSPRWCMVHATHLDPAEIAGLTASGAVAGLCPTTEANLGDGIFPAEAFLAAGGRFGIGSDSHVATGPWEELRWLEYVQRLVTRRRGVLRIPDRPDSTPIGEWLWNAALAGGAQALGRPIGRLAAGCRADLVVLDPAMLEVPAAAVLDLAIFRGSDNPVRDVMVGGRWVVRDGVHPEEAALRRDGAAVLRALAD